MDINITGVSSSVVIDTAVKSADASTNNEVEKSTQNVESQTDTESRQAVPQASGGLGENVDVTV